MNYVKHKLIASFVAGVMMATSNASLAAGPLRCGIVSHIAQLGGGGTAISLDFFFSKQIPIRKGLWRNAVEAAPGVFYSEECNKFVSAGKTCKTDMLEHRQLIGIIQNNRKKYIPIQESALFTPQMGPLIGGYGKIRTSTVALLTKGRRCAG